MTDWEIRGKDRTHSEKKKKKKPPGKKQWHFAEVVWRGEGERVHSEDTAMLKPRKGLKGKMPRLRRGKNRGKEGGVRRGWCRASSEKGWMASECTCKRKRQDVGSVTVEKGIWRDSAENEESRVNSAWVWDA